MVSFARDGGLAPRKMAAQHFMATTLPALHLSMPGFMVPLLFGLMGFAAGSGGPSRDLIVKRATPPHASGRVYGVVYSGLDIGQAIA